MLSTHLTQCIICWRLRWFPYSIQTNQALGYILTQLPVFYSPILNFPLAWLCRFVTLSEHCREKVHLGLPPVSSSCLYQSHEMVVIFEGERISGLQISSNDGQEWRYQNGRAVTSKPCMACPGDSRARGCKGRRHSTVVNDCSKSCPHP